MNSGLFELRRELHRIPEPAFEEHKTKELLLARLRGFEGIRIQEFSGSTGILVEYTAGGEDYRLFRADMDALPIKENTGCGFESQHQGMMHACGHDAHMAILMGLIERISKLQPKQNLLFVFQPAEEGKGGAESILAEGLIQSYPVREVYALHVASGLETGILSSRSGIFFGLPQEFDVLLTGKTAHAAYPEQGINALAAGRRFLELMDRDIAVLAGNQRVIFHVGRCEAGTIRNVIPGTCVLEGTHRSLSKTARDKMNQMILDNCAVCANEFGVEYMVDFLCSYDPVINAEELVNALEKVCGEAGYGYQEAETAMTGEDFGFFTSLWPGLLFWLGSGCEHPLHSDRFLADENCIPVGVEVFSRLAMR